MPREEATPPVTNRCFVVCGFTGIQINSSAALMGRKVRRVGDVHAGVPLHGVTDGAGVTDVVGVTDADTELDGVGLAGVDWFASAAATAPTARA